MYFLLSRNASKSIVAKTVTYTDSYGLGCQGDESEAKSLIVWLLQRKRFGFMWPVHEGFPARIAGARFLDQIRPLIPPKMPFQNLPEIISHDRARASQPKR